MATEVVIDLSKWPGTAAYVFMRKAGAGDTAMVRLLSLAARSATWW